MFENSALLFFVFRLKNQAPKVKSCSVKLEIINIDDFIGDRVETVNIYYSYFLSIL